VALETQRSKIESFSVRTSQGSALACPPVAPIAQRKARDVGFWEVSQGYSSIPGRSKWVPLLVVDGSWRLCYSYLHLRTSSPPLIERVLRIISSVFNYLR
jgi:hypothetical protein